MYKIILNSKYLLKIIITYFNIHFENQIDYKILFLKLKLQRIEEIKNQEEYKYIYFDIYPNYSIN